jgi:hypothetical protein
MEIRRRSTKETIMPSDGGGRENAGVDKAIHNISSTCSVVVRAPSLSSSRHRVFLLSPANASGVRARLILRDSARTELAKSLRSGGVQLGQVFSFISGLYFRGKLTYARAYADPPPGTSGIFVITASGGLVSPDKIFTLDDLRAILTGNVDVKDSQYRIPLERDARLLCDQMGAHCEAVLLGSVATPKYVEPLVSIFGERLMFPAEFVGRGDMSRGGLLLRCAREKVELQYIPVAGSVGTFRARPKAAQDWKSLR